MESSLSILSDLLQSGVEQGIFIIENKVKLIDYMVFMMRAFMPPYYDEVSKKDLNNMSQQFADMVICSISK